MSDAAATRPVCGLSEVAKTGWLIAAIVAHNLVYPIATTGILGTVAFYAFYGSIFVVGTWWLSHDWTLRLATLATGAAVFMAGVWAGLADGPGRSPAVFLTSIAYHAVFLVVLARYTFGARQVMTETILAATALYLVIGSAFAAVFATVEWLQPGSFVGPDGPVASWQEHLYFSYVTLTSAGYGDILPRRPLAQATAVAEAIVGVLYTVILLARLVGLHTATPPKT
ncbi:ion channel [Jannaschia sp. LMIT008]|uniref:ion channel n=1 Tax=Jannaschia maritima TaxID=3032585 RepID=UPI002810FE27|nr:ion channel [Jannaschia sp. LMIT008]